MSAGVEPAQAGMRLDQAAAELFGEFSRAECGALGALLNYVTLTQAGRLPSLNPPRRAASASFKTLQSRIT